MEDKHPEVKEEVAVEEESADNEPEVDIHITNVVSNFATRCHLNLRHIANSGSNVIYKREQAMVSMKLRNPNATASIWSSGKITVTGSTSEDAAKKSARRVARILQKLGFKVRFSAFRIVNVLGIVNLPFGIRLVQFTEHHPRVCSYEPEIHPGATYKYKDIKATFKIFQTGAITITAPNVAAIEAAVQHIYPLVFPFHKDKPNDPNLAHMKKLKAEAAMAAAATNGSSGTVGQKRSKSDTNGKRKKRKTSVDSSESLDDFIVEGSESEEAGLSSGGDEEEAEFSN